jgi:hypothetical protein
MDKQKIAKPYEEALRMSRLLTAQGLAGSRSSRRTDVLNAVFINEVLRPQLGHDWEFMTEHRIMCARGDTFKVDIAAYHNGKLCCIFLLKAIETCYNRNRHNYANTGEGEVGRIFDYPGRGHNLSVFAVDWIPKKVRAPTPTNKTRLTIPKIPDMSRSENRWNSHLQAEYENASVVFCKIRFDFDEESKTATNIDGADKLLENLNRVAALRS